MDNKFLTEDGWKAVVTKFKLKDKELQKTLLSFEMLLDDDFEYQLKYLVKIAALAGSLKKDKAVAGTPDVMKYLTNMIAATEAEKREVAKAKAAADQAKKKEEAEAKKQDAEDAAKTKAGGEEDEEEQEEGDYAKKFLAAFQKLKAKKDLVFQYLICDAKPHCGLTLAKRIGPKHKQELTEVTGGGKRFLKIGNCRVDGGKILLEMEQPVPGLARRLLDSIKFFTDKKIPVMIGDQSSEDEEEAAGSGGASKPAPAPAARPGQPSDGGDEEEEEPDEKEEEPTSGAGAQPGKEEEDEETEGEEVEPPATPEKASLGKAPEVWQQTRKFIETRIAQLKEAIRKAFAGQDKALLAEIEQNLGRLDGVLKNLDDKLANSLAKAQAASDPAAKKAELNNAKTILANYINYVKGEPLIASLDANPFGVKFDLKALLTDKLTHMAKAMA